MANWRDLQLHPWEYKTTRLGPRNYRSVIKLRDWDDGSYTELTVDTPGPIIGIKDLEIRILVEDIPEAPEEGALSHVV